MSGETYLRAHPPVVDTRTAAVNVEAVRVRVTVAQCRAALDVLHDRGSHPSMESLAEALALAVVTAEDDTLRYVVCVLNPGGAGFYVYGPYATRASAEKALQSGLALREGARGGIFGLSPAPRAAKTPTRKSKQSPGQISMEAA